MKYRITEFLKKEYPDIDFDVSYPPEGLGDYSTNISFLLAKKRKENPKKIAEEVIGKLEKKFKEFEKIEAVGGGFINFYLSQNYLLERLDKFLKDKIEFPKVKSQKINLEFVSANPTGPLTVGNARAAAYGDTLGNILKKVGHEVKKEYYINDIGVQVEKMAKSEINQSSVMAGIIEPVYKEDDLYQGQWVITGMESTARALRVPPRELYKQKFEKVEEKAIETKVENIEKSLADLGIKYDKLFRESLLYKNKEVEETLGLLKKNKATFEKEGATWLKFDDKEDDVAVLVKSDGSTTYLMNDIAYTKDKFQRGFDKAINLWGADHYGAVLRLKEGIKALGYDPNRLEILIHQLVLLKKDGQLVKMSKREGNIETLDDLLKEVGKDVTRFFFLTKDLNTHMEFDVDLAKEQSSKNPVYYIQYAFARINSVFEKAGDKKASKDLELIKEKEELDLIKQLIRFPEVVFDISQNYQVHHMAQYAFELANRFHKFYEKQRIISEDEKLTGARLALVKGVQTIFGESLTLMGLEKPKRM